MSIVGGRHESTHDRAWRREENLEGIDTQMRVPVSDPRSVRSLPVWKEGEGRGICSEGNRNRRGDPRPTEGTVQEVGRK